MHFSKDPKTLRLFCKAQVSSYVVKGIKTKITAKFRDTEHLCFEETKRIQETDPSGRKLQGRHPHACFVESHVS